MSIGVWVIVGLVVAIAAGWITATPLIVAGGISYLLWKTGLPGFVKMAATGVAILIALASPVWGPMLSPLGDNAKTQVGQVTNQLNQK